MGARFCRLRRPSCSCENSSPPASTQLPASACNFAAASAALRILEASSATFLGRGVPSDRSSAPPRRSFYYAAYVARAEAVAVALTLGALQLVFLHRVTSNMESASAVHNFVVGEPAATLPIFRMSALLCVLLATTSLTLHWFEKYLINFPVLLEIDPQIEVR